MTLSLVVGACYKCGDSDADTNIEANDRSKEIISKLEKHDFDHAQSAIADYIKAANSNASLAQANWLKGKLEYAKGSNGHARRFFQQAIALDANHAIYYEDLVSSLQESFRWIEAYDLVLKTRRRFPYSSALTISGSPSLACARFYERRIKDHIRYQSSFDDEAADAMCACQMIEQTTNAAWTLFNSPGRAKNTSARARLLFLRCSSMMPAAGGAKEQLKLRRILDAQLELELVGAVRDRAELRDLIRVAVSLGRWKFVEKAAQLYCRVYERTPEFVLYASSALDSGWGLAFRKIIAETDDTLYRDELESEYLFLAARLNPSSNEEYTDKLSRLLYRELSSGFHSIWLQLGNLEFSRKHYEQAEKCFRKYYQLEPGETDMPYAIARSLIARADKKAVPAFQRACVIDPMQNFQLTLAAAELATHCKARKDHIGYRQYILLALHNCPANDWQFAQLCLDAHMQNVDVDITRLPAYQSLTELQTQPLPTFPAAEVNLQQLAMQYRILQFINWIELLSATGSAESALCLADRLVEIAPDQYGAFLSIAKAFQQEGSRHRALAVLRKAIDLCQKRGNGSYHFWDAAVRMCLSLDVDTRPLIKPWLTAGNVDPALLASALRQCLLTCASKSVDYEVIEQAARYIVKSKLDSHAFVVLVKQLVLRKIESQASPADLAKMFVLSLPALTDHELEVAELFPCYLDGKECLAVMDSIVNQQQDCAAVLRLRAALLSSMGNTKLARRDIDHLKLLDCGCSNAQLAQMQNKYSHWLSARELQALRAVQEFYKDL